MLETIAKKSKIISKKLTQQNQQFRNETLLSIADELLDKQDIILKANQIDIDATSKHTHYNSSFIDRLTLTKKRILQICETLNQIAQLPSPIGNIIEGKKLDNGLHLIKQQIPLGVIAAIYESRPNITVELSALCIKTGNAIILRGGKETINTNKVLVELMKNTLIKNNKNIEDSVHLITDNNRQLITQLLQLDQFIDLAISRGGSTLHDLCKKSARVPLICGGEGVCHTYMDENIQQEKAIDVVINAKTQRPSTCNTLETLLINKKEARILLPKLISAFKNKNVICHLCDKSLEIIQKEEQQYNNIQPLDKARLNKEWLSLDINILLVNDLEEAIQHIEQYGTGHSEAIITENMNNAQRFIDQINACAIYVNASTRFTDGGVFGLGSEVAISTQKMPPRGPMGLDALTTYKWIARGNYLSRPD